MIRGAVLNSHVNAHTTIASRSSVSHATCIDLFGPPRFAKVQTPRIRESPPNLERGVSWITSARRRLDRP